MRQIRQSPAGFTLLEMLIVMTLIVFLFALLTPTLQSAREQTRRSECASNMRQIGLALRMYMDDHGGQFPPTSIRIDATTYDNSKNWQSFLGDSSLQGNYLPAGFITYNPGNEAKRFKAGFLCPTIARKYNISGNHDQWGYSINHARTGITHQVDKVNGDFPWGLPQYIGANADILYTKQAKYAVLADGNGSALNTIPTDWDAVAGNPGDADWEIEPTHNRTVNVLFMDAHVEARKLDTPGDVQRFNIAWFGGIPSAGANPYLNQD